MKNIAIKSLGGSSNLHITLYKDSWKIPQGRLVNTSIDFMDDEPLLLDAYGDGKVLDLSIPTQVTAVFIGLLHDSKQLRISFPSGREQPWIASLAKLQPLLTKFVSCARQQETTQPF